MRNNILPLVGFVSEIASTSGFVKSLKFEVRSSRLRHEENLPAWLVPQLRNLELHHFGILIKLRYRIHVLIITNQELQYE